MAAHLHRPVRYQSMGKTGCVYVFCRCGAYQAVGVWHTEAFSGWDPIHWRKHAYLKIVATDARWEKHVKKLRRQQVRIALRCGDRPSWV